MAGSMEQPAFLFVEGDDDMHVITHLLMQHDITWNLEAPAHPFPQVEVTEGVNKLLERVETEVRAGTGRTIGFVLDADSSITSRWQAVRNRLREANVEAPDKPLPNGYVGEAPKHGCTVGVWLMPDNEHEGKLEDFLQTLIDEEDVLIGHAESATCSAKQLGATFSDPDNRKAILHAWLAWQQEPGKPYGSAIRRKYFEHDSEVANRFVAWFKQLYRIDT